MRTVVHVFVGFVIGAACASWAARWAALREYDDQAATSLQIAMRLSDPNAEERLGQWEGDLAVKAFGNSRNAAIHYFLRAIEENGGVSNGANLFLASYLGSRSCKSALFFCTQHERLNGSTEDSRALRSTLGAEGCDEEVEAAAGDSTVR